MLSSNIVSVLKSSCLIKTNGKQHVKGHSGGMLHLCVNHDSWMKAKI